jgi:oxygen-independent coproporphyrinogen-3 oxidase
MAVLPDAEPLPTAPEAGPGFGIYVHWPFCAAKCPYCDFNSHVADEAPDQARWLAAYKAELAHFARRTPGQTVSTVFFGGGTPSLMDGSTVAGILDEIARLWSVVPDAEITLEANPNSADAARFAEYRSAGVNRLSLGVQALRDDALTRLGRLHDVREAKAAIEAARAIFPRYSLDFIYARAGQSLADWRSELNEALALAGDHVSLYQLTIEKGTPFFAAARDGRLELPDEDLARGFYDETQEICEKAGLPAYEISNHARPGGASRHNLIYWRYGEYAGIGAGAHGRIVSAGARRATAAISNPARWLAQVENLGHGLCEDAALEPGEEADEFLLMGLRLEEGIALSRYQEIAGMPLSASRLDGLLAVGLIELRGNDRIAASVAGRPLLNALVAALTD